MFSFAVKVKTVKVWDLCLGSLNYTREIHMNLMQVVTLNPHSFLCAAAWYWAGGEHRAFKAARGEETALNSVKTWMRISASRQEGTDFLCAVEVEKKKSCPRSARIWRRQWCPTGCTVQWRTQQLMGERKSNTVRKYFIQTFWQAFKKNRYFPRLRLGCKWLKVGYISASALRLPTSTLQVGCLGAVLQARITCHTAAL